MVDSDSSKPEKLATLLARALAALLALGIVSAIIPQLISYAAIRSKLDAYSGDGSADAYTTAIHWKLRLAFTAIAVVCALLLTIQWWQSKRIIAFLADALSHCRSTLRETFSGRGRTVLYISLTAIVLSVLYASIAWQFVVEPIRYDEAHTYLNYVSKPVFMTITQYDAPNNHVLFSLLAKCSLTLFGDSVASLRLPALLCGCLLITVLLAAGWCYCHPAVGIAAALLLMSNPTFVEAATNARGHLTGTVFLTLTALTLQWSYGVKYRGLPLWFAALCIGLALFTVPTTLYGLFLIFFWSILQALSKSALDPSNTKSKLYLAVQNVSAFIAGGALATFLYLPILLTNSFGQIASVASSQRPDPLQVAKDIPGYLANLWVYYTWDTPSTINWILVLCLIAMAITSIIRLTVATKPISYFSGQLLRILVSVLLVLLLVIAHRTLPPDRVLLFVVPLCSLLIAAWLYDLCDWGFAQAKTATPLIFSFVIFACMTWHTLASANILTSERHATVREGLQVAQWLHEHAAPKQPIIAVTPESATVVYFYLKQGWDLDHFLVPQPDSNYDQGAIVLTHDTFQTQPIPVLQELHFEEIFDGDHPTLLQTIGHTNIWHVDQRKHTSQ